MQKHATRDLAELKQRPVKVSADFKLTIFDRAIDQWRNDFRPVSRLVYSISNSCCNLYFHLSFVVCIRPNSQFLMIEKSRCNHVNCNDCMAHLIFNAVVIITGSAVAMHCCKAHERINRKRGNSTPCKIVTPENFSSKVCTRDYVGTATTMQIFVKIDSVGASPQIGEI